MFLFLAILLLVATDQFLKWKWCLLRGMSSFSVVLFCVITLCRRVVIFCLSSSVILCVIIFFYRPIIINLSLCHHSLLSYHHSVGHQSFQCVITSMSWQLINIPLWLPQIFVYISYKPLWSYSFNIKFSLNITKYPPNYVAGCNWLYRHSYQL